MGAHLIFYRAKFHIFSESEGIEGFGTTYWRNVTGGSHDHLTCLIQSPTVYRITHQRAELEMIHTVTLLHSLPSTLPTCWWISFKNWYIAFEDVSSTPEFYLDKISRKIWSMGVNIMVFSVFSAS